MKSGFRSSLANSFARKPDSSGAVRSTGIYPRANPEWNYAALYQANVFAANVFAATMFAANISGLHPQRIYLFGPRARGAQISGQSDFDLLVVVPESDLPRHPREARSYATLWGLSTPVDLIVLTRNEFNQSSRVKTSLAYTAQTQGKLLYG